MSYRTYQELASPRRSRPGTFALAAGLTLLSLLSLLVAAEIPYRHYLGWAGRTDLEHPATPPDIFSAPAAVEGTENLEEIDLFRTGGRQHTATAATVRHPLGTDRDGRDVLADVMAGLRIMLLGGLWATLITVALGLAGGVIIGAGRRALSVPAEFLLSVFTAFPPLALLLLAVIAFGFGPLAIMTAVGAVNAPRLVQVLAGKLRFLKEQEFVAALREAGLSQRLILWRHLLWNNSRRLILVQVVYAFAAAIMLEVSLSFLGYGIMKPDLSLGVLIGRGWASLMAPPEGRLWWDFAFSMAAVILALSGYYLVGEGLSRRYQMETGR
ncbi:MAG: hypothetical protein C4524_14935 [Candidatus Zixiibacteriota bacterium]|nr:MAG: hypothetical protein C4524_14935 [candidate division Zixibacteria bacterium]